MAIDNTCMVPEVIQKLQTLVDEQQIRMEEVSGETSDLLNQVKSVRNQLSSLKNAIFNAQQGLKDVAEQRNSMCDQHYMKSKVSRPWEEQLHLDKALEKFIGENDFEENLNFIPSRKAHEDTTDRPFECTEDGCTSTYKKKKDLNRHIRDKHTENKHTNENDIASYEETKDLDFDIPDDKSTDQIKAENRRSKVDLAKYTGHQDVDYNYSVPKGRSKSYTDKEYACDECEYVSTGRQDRLKRHKETVHSDLKPFSCQFCEFAAKRKDKLKVHLEKKHRNDVF